MGIIAIILLVAGGGYLWLYWSEDHNAHAIKGILCLASAVVLLLLAPGGARTKIPGQLSLAAYTCGDGDAGWSAAYVAAVPFVAQTGVDLVNAGSSPACYGDISDVPVIEAADVTVAVFANIADLQAYCGGAADGCGGLGGGRRIAIYGGSSVVGATLAHEIGHAAGLWHYGESQNLMANSSEGHIVDARYIAALREWAGVK